MPPDAAPPHVGLFDSGIGGLSVLRALRRQLPGLRISYVADTACTPWGERPADWVVARSLQLSAWLIDRGADLVLVACNTATTQAIAALRARWPEHAFVGVEPGVKPAVAASRRRRVAVMATPGTLRSPRLRQLVDAHGAGATVLDLPCPGLADAIERADPDDAALAALLDGIAASLRRAEVDTVVLGCTHYPLVADALQQRLGAGVRLVDTGDAVARRVATLLGTRAAAVAAPAPPGPLALWATGNTAGLQRAAQHWLGAPAGPSEPARPVADIAVAALALPPPAVAGAAADRPPSAPRP